VNYSSRQRYTAANSSLSPVDQSLYYSIADGTTT
jgi:hypothetical protein